MFGRLPLSVQGRRAFCNSKRYCWIVATTMLNQHYDSHEAYLTALAKALSNEYRAIHPGMVLQIDAPDLAMERHRFFSHMGEAEFLRQLELHIAAIYLGIEGIPRERIRLHACWGNSDGPHVQDIAMTLGAWSQADRAR